MEIQIGIEVTLVEPANVFSVRRSDLAVAHVLANHRPVLGFHQAVVIALATRFGLLDQQSLQQPGQRFVDLNSEPLSE